jgi:D-alanyl-D-alanine carboxypeptidase
VLLGLVIERATGKKLHEVFRERILIPLEMTDTYISYHEPPRLAAESHRYEGPLDLYGERRQSADWAGGGLVSSTRDLTRFVFALAQGRLFRNPGTLDRMMTWRPTGTKDVDYGLGLFHIRLDGELGQFWGHDGHGNAFMYYWPERQLAFVGTLNQTENSWWDLVSDALEKLGEGTSGASRNGEHPG